MHIITFEDFIEEAWDYVSPFVVTDEYWEANHELITEITFELYELYRKSGYVDSNDMFVADIKPKTFGRILEVFFSMFSKYQGTLESYWENQKQKG